MGIWYKYNSRAVLIALKLTLLFSLLLGGGYLHLHTMHMIFQTLGDMIFWRILSSHLQSLIGVKQLRRQLAAIIETLVVIFVLRQGFCGFKKIIKK